MEKNIMNAEIAEVVQPQVETGAEIAETAQPQDKEVTADDINNMTSAEFDEYIKNLNMPSYSEHEPEEEEVSDKTDTEQEQAETEEDNMQEQPEPEYYKTFASEDEYNREVQGRIDAAFGKRFKDDREKNEKYDRVYQSAKSFYPDAEDPMAALAEDLDTQAAEKSGVNVEQYRQQQADAIDAKKYRDSLKQKEQAEQNKQRIINEWRSDSAKLKSMKPDFDFDTAMKNPSFYNAIASGKNVFEAYNMIASPPAQPGRKPIAQNGQMRKKTTGSVNTDPSKYDTKAFMQYINKIKGE